MATYFETPKSGFTTCMYSLGEDISCIVRTAPRARAWLICITFHKIYLIYKFYV